MDHGTPKIVVAGDVTVDRLQWAAAPADSGLNWQLYPGVNWGTLPGGALLLADMLRCAGGADVRSARPEDLADASPEQILHSLVELDQFPIEAGSKDKARVYRIARFHGYTGLRGAPSSQLRVVDDDPAADVLVLDDAANGFRDAKQLWPAAMTAQPADGHDAAGGPLVVCKMYSPLMQGKLWDEYLSRLPPERLVLVISADALRGHGISFGRRLSWERTAKEFVWQMACNAFLRPLTTIRHLIVRFGLEGVLHRRAMADHSISRLYFDPAQIEGGYGDLHPGKMQGLADAFVAALVWSLACPPPPGKEPQQPEPMAAGIEAGMRAAHRLLKLGYGPGPDLAAFPSPALFEPPDGKETIALVEIPHPEAAEPPDPRFWSILKDVKGAELETLAQDLVIEGTTSALQGVPLGQFGNLRTADRAEIEGLRSIRNLMDEYLDGQVTRPLSIAVFGAPGAGKSFAVKQVAASISGRRELKPLEFNLSQFRSPEGLTQAFHRVRDTALEGAVPLVFFDEFDAAFEGRLGWLKYFLAPMQDGVFLEGETNHPVGRAIFIFAGGTYTSFESFAGLNLDNDPSLTPQECKEIRRHFKDVKGPDFVSRLRGYVNILGPNPVNDADATHVVRRAVLLRSLIERKAKQLLHSHDKVGIDRGVLRALLFVPFYRHGARSMEAILDMSMLAGQTRWEPAALPPPDQLRLHVDPELFNRLVLRDVLIDLLAPSVHEHYRAMQKDIQPADDPAMRPWPDLEEELRESNRQQAAHIPEKLNAIGRSLRPVSGRPPEMAAFSAWEIEFMAELEHRRWMKERSAEGWAFASARDPARKISPSLVPWDDLTEEVKDWDRQTVAAIPGIVASVHFEIYRSGPGSEAFRSRTALRETLGRAIHDLYRKNQQATLQAGDAAMKSWEELAEDLRESNRQQADHITVKLRRLGYGVRPPAGDEPAQLAFGETELELMAEMEHERWVAERQRAGWQRGAKRDADRKITPYLAPWDELPEEAKELDRQAVRGIPAVLAQAKLEVHRLGSKATQSKTPCE